ncbi:hypothetical protein PAXRUDRAFT_794795 [Paxillus rubicundulus Ve08.2h10]|uniref:Tyr recombinase domain-containing protein n=1 Tax=Paxillus rubicundulus Ve08.2h10 TaxID=930991 RepID=A0A0D0DZ19_9AGAM|nr:hypothetical protein PAXRUDRAFT_794795 [Paxillus rubicundulus Ve08.2h10]
MPMDSSVPLTPFHFTTSAPPILETTLDRILHVIGASWTDSTKELYGTGLLIFHVYSDLNQIPEPKYSSSAITNYASALCAWHILHGHPLSIQRDELKTILNGATRLTPKTSKRSQRPPLTIEAVKVIRAHLNLDDPRDAAIFACIIIVLYCVARLGEFTVPAISKFNPSEHITRAGLLHLWDPEGLLVMKFRIPFTKCSATGEDTQCTPLPGCITDPQAALENHFRVNPAPQDAHLFSWKHPKSGLCPLSKTEVTSRLTAVSKACSLSNLKGHSLRIGGTLHYLLKGVPFDVVKVMGRWARNSFTLYLCNHTLILALFLQADNDALASFNHFTMPPGC